jgi:hypothetical protein
MREFPFQRRPDSFYLTVPKSDSRVDLRAFESPFGVTDEILCFFDGVLLGQLAIGAVPDNLLFVNLATQLDPRRRYDWPSGEDFHRILIAIILTVPGAYLHCERDTDQEPLPRIENQDEVVEAVGRVVTYCLEGGVFPCPTFCYETRGGQQQSWL